MKKDLEKQITRLKNTFAKDMAGKIRVCDLGSCQYTSVQVTFEYALAFLRLDRARFEDELGITYKRELNEKEFIDSLREIIRVDRSEDEDLKDEPMPEINSISDYFDYSRDIAYDLWSAAVSPLENFEMEPHQITNAPKTGFLLNDLITTTESFPTGIHLAYITYLFDEPIETYADFAT